LKTNAVPIVIEQNNYKVTYPGVVSLGETREDHPAGNAMLNLPPGQDGVGDAGSQTLDPAAGTAMPGQ